MSTKKSQPKKLTRKVSVSVKQNVEKEVVTNLTPAEIRSITKHVHKYLGSKVDEPIGFRKGCVEVTLDYLEELREALTITPELLNGIKTILLAMQLGDFHKVAELAENANLRKLVKGTPLEGLLLGGGDEEFGTKRSQINSPFDWFRYRVLYQNW
jgi:hypothetical protein